MKKAFFCIADANNLKYFEMLKNSLKKFDKETDLILIGDNDIKNANDKMIFYRATPYFAKKLLESYDVVCKLDADQIITGNLDHIWEGDFDFSVVNNSNPIEMQTSVVAVWDINPLAYVNCGFVVMRSKEFVDHWLNLCYSPHFDNYQMKEQDLLNILAFYGNYKVNFLDSTGKWHGLVSKGYWPQVKLEGEKLILPKDDTWPNDADKEIVCLHWAGGNQAPDKMNFKIRFQPEVVERLTWLTNP